MPTSARASIALWSAFFPLMPSWISSGSVSWVEIFRNGFSDVIGSWKIIETRFPRILRSCFWLAWRRSVPSKMAFPE